MAPAEPVQDNWIELLDADAAVKLVGAAGAAIAVVTAALPVVVPALTLDGGGPAAGGRGRVQPAAAEGADAAAGQRPGPGRLRAHDIAKLVRGGGRELLGGAVEDGGSCRRERDPGHGLVDRRGNAAGGRQSAWIGKGDHEGVGAGLVECRRRVLRCIGAVEAEGRRCRAGWALVTDQV